MFIVKPNISARDARNMAVEMGLCGNHNKDLDGHIKTVKDIKLHFRENKMDFGAEVRKYRNFSHHVAMYENLLGAQWTTHGATVTRLNHKTGKHEEVVSGDGTYNESDYWANFDLARKDFGEAISKSHYERYLSAVNLGISSIESFLNHQYLILMRGSADEEELRKDIEFKFNDWVPRFTGSRFEKSGRNWADFKELKKLRNDHFQHRKSITTGIKFKELERLFNMFKTGICRILLELHKMFNQRCPTWIIRYSYYPEIEYVRDE